MKSKIIFLTIVIRSKIAITGLFLLASGTDSCFLGTLDTLLTVSEFLSLFSRFLFDLVSESMSYQSVSWLVSSEKTDRESNYIGGTLSNYSTE